jgi:hypothetical protein
MGLWEHATVTHQFSWFLDSIWISCNKNTN